MDFFLKMIEDNYIVFLLITIFLMLSLIGYVVDKKTRKDSDLKPMFSKIGKEKKPKDPNGPADKKSRGLKLSFGKKAKTEEPKAPVSAPQTPNIASPAPQAPATPTPAVSAQPSNQVNMQMQDTSAPVDKL